MAKRRNKARKIREALAEFAAIGEEPTAGEVVERLAAMRVRVTPQQVYAARNSGPKPASRSPFAAVLDAQKLLQTAGSVASARKALNVVAQLQRRKPR